MAAFLGSLVKSFILPKPNPSYDTAAHPGRLLHIPKVDWKTRRETGAFTYGLLLLDPTAKHIVIYAHTNAVDMGMMFDALSYLSKRASTSVLMFEYTGYGISYGETTERSMNEDMLSAYCYVVRYLHVPANRIVLMGRSIGTGPSAQVCASLQDECETPALLVLQSPFTSLKECANEITRNVGSIMSFLGYDWFRTIDVIAQVRCPVIIHHGSLDDVVPFEHAEQLKKVIETASPPGFVELHVDACKHNDLPVVNAARIIDKKLRELAQIRCLQIKLSRHLIVNPPIYEYLFCVGDKPMTTVDALLQHWNGTLSIGSFAFRREKLYILLVAGVALFAMRCARIWQCYTGSWKRHHNGEANGENHQWGKEDIINHCMACWGSPLGVFLATGSRPALHKIFGAHLLAVDAVSYVDGMNSNVDGNDSCQTYEENHADSGGGGSSSSSTSGGGSGKMGIRKKNGIPALLAMVYEDQAAYLGVAELEFTPALMKSVAAAISTAPTLAEEAQGSGVFLQKDVVTRIQTECERLVAFLDETEWNNLLDMLRHFGDTAPTLLSSKAFQLYTAHTLLESGGDMEESSRGGKKESIADVKEWLNPWMTNTQLQVQLGREMPWDYYLLKARLCVQEDHQLGPDTCWVEVRRILDAWVVVANIYRLFNTYSRRCLHPSFSGTRSASP